MGRPRLYATSVERKAAWRRRHGMALRPHYPSAAATQDAYWARKQQTARDLANRECAAIQQALQTRAQSDQCWEMYGLIDDRGRDSDMPRQAQEDRDTSLPAGAIAIFHGAAAARLRQHCRALQRRAHVKATKRAHSCALSAASAKGCAPLPHTRAVRGSCDGDVA
jgi:hypothetical protein